MFQKWVPFSSTVRQDTMPYFSVLTTVCTESSAMHTAQKIVTNTPSNRLGTVFDKGGEEGETPDVRTIQNGSPRMDGI